MVDYKTGRRPLSTDDARSSLPLAIYAVAAARVFDAATTRRRSVVFEEDDELDVPDFLK